MEGFLPCRPRPTAVTSLSANLLGRSPCGTRSFSSSTGVTGWTEPLLRRISESAGCQQPRAQNKTALQFLLSVDLPNCSIIQALTHATHSRESFAGLCSSAHTWSTQQELGVLHASNTLFSCLTSQLVLCLLRQRPTVVSYSVLHLRGHASTIVS